MMQASNTGDIVRTDVIPDHRLGEGVRILSGDHQNDPKPGVAVTTGPRVPVERPGDPHPVL